MGAEIDKSNNFVFGMDKPELDAGAIAIGDSIFAGNSINYLSTIHTEIASEKHTWSVCPHLSEPELVYDYYLSSGMLIILLGHCFCESCLDMILSQDDMSEMVRSSRKMTDRQFQRKFIEPLFSSNTKFTSSYKYQEKNDDSRKTWITCSHLASGDGIRDVYLNAGQICIFESYFTCQDCFNNIPTESLVDILYKGEAMTNSNIQERVIDHLYEINLDGLSALGRFDKNLLAGSF